MLSHSYPHMYASHYSYHPIMLFLLKDHYFTLQHSLLNFYENHPLNFAAHSHTWLLGQCHLQINLPLMAAPHHSYSVSAPLPPPLTFVSHTPIDVCIKEPRRHHTLLSHSHTNLKILAHLITCSNTSPSFFIKNIIPSDNLLYHKSLEHITGLPCPPHHKLFLGPWMPYTAFCLSQGTSLLLF